MEEREAEKFGGRAAEVERRRSRRGSEELQGSNRSGMYGFHPKVPLGHVRGNERMSCGIS